MALRLTVLGSVTEAGTFGKANEDIAGSTLKSAWVLDGATGLGADDLIQEQSAAAWLVSAYQHRLLAISNHSLVGVHKLFRRIILGVKSEFKTKRSREIKHRYEEPSAGMIFVQLRAQQLEWASLGDCRAILRDTAGRVIDTPGSAKLQQLDGKVLAQMKELREQATERGDDSPPYDELLAAVAPMLQENRSWLNAAGGYWALSTDPIAAQKLESGEIEVAEQGTSVQGLLVSDGLYRLVDTFKEYENEQLLDAALQPGGLGALLTELRRQEIEDPECRTALRLKRRDDATALLFEISST